MLVAIFGSCAVVIVVTGVAPDLSRHSRSSVSLADSPLEYSIVLGLACLMAGGSLWMLIGHLRYNRHFDAVMRSKEQLQAINPIVRQVEPETAAGKRQSSADGEQADLG